MKLLELFALLAISLNCAGQGGLCVLRLESPNYPDLARQAQLSGTVTVRVTIDENGSVLSANASGPRLLREEAERNSRTWLFSRGATRELEIVYQFQLTEPKLSYRPVPEVWLNLPRSVTITSHAPVPIRDGVVLKPKEK